MVFILFIIIDVDCFYFFKEFGFKSMVDIF